MFGIGFQELVVIGLLFLVLFGPKQLPRMARDIGRFVNEAQRAVEEFKSELMSEENQPGFGTPGSEKPGKERAVSSSRKRAG